MVFGILLKTQSFLIIYINIIQSLTISGEKSKQKEKKEKWKIKRIKR